MYNAIEELPCRYSVLINPALEALEINDTEKVDDLYDSITSPESAKSLCDFLALMSLPTNYGTSEDNIGIDKLALKSSPGTLGVPFSTNDRLAQMLRVSGFIAQYLGNHPMSQEVEKFKVMIGYAMLFITLEHGIVPAMKANNPPMGDQAISRQKMKIFREQLEARHGVRIKENSLKEKIRYGKVLWEMIKMGGVLMLPMLAVAGPGITSLAHDHGVTTRHIPFLASHLSENNLWMAMSQSLGPVAVELIFSPSCQVYTSTELMHYLLLEPLSAYLRRNLHHLFLNPADADRVAVAQLRLYRNPVQLGHKAASKMLHQFGLEISMFPCNTFPNPTSYQVKLAQWIISQDGNRVIKLPTNNTTSRRVSSTVKLQAFTSFLHPAQIADEPVNFLSRLWTLRALPGWGMISPVNTMKALEGHFGDSPETALSLAAGGRHLGVPYSYYLLPIATNLTILPLLVSLTQHKITLLVLRGSETTIECANNLLKVRILSCYK